MTSCRAFTPHPVFPYRRPNKTPIARQAATAIGERIDDPGAAQADIDRRQRSPSVPGRHLAPALRTTPPRRSRALLRELSVRAVLVGDALRRYLCRRARSRKLFIEFGTRRYPVGRSAEGTGVDELPPDGPARPHGASPYRSPHRGAVDSPQ